MDSPLRQIYVKFAAKCLACHKTLEVGNRANYHVKLKKLLCIGCPVPEEKQEPVKRKKIFGKYTLIDTIAALHDLNVLQSKAASVLDLLEVEVTPGTFGTINTVYANRRRGENYTKFAEEDLQKLAAIARLQTVKTPEATQTTQVDLSEYVKKSELASMQESIDDKIAAIEQREPVEVIIKQLNKKPINAGVQHKMFPTLLSYLALGHNVWLIGPAGSGKTRGAREVAKHLKLHYYSKSLCRLTPVSHLLGYMDANGKYVSTDFRKCIESGGLFLLDECDAGSPDVLTAFNDALAADAGDMISFPDKMVKKHEDFIAIAAANTFGEGANRQYVSRLQQDAASLDRFTFLEWGYDEALELHIAGDETWVTRVQTYRKAADAMGIRHIISPRASIKGAIALKAGRPLPEVEQALIWKGLEAETIQKIKEHTLCASLGGAN